MNSESVAANGALADANNLSAEESPFRSGQKYHLPEGLGKSQRKNLKKKLREKERKAEEAAGIRRDAQLLEDPLQAERTQALQSALTELAGLPSLAEMKPTDVIEQFRIQQDVLQNILSNLDEALESFFTKVKRPDNRRLTSSQLLDRIRELSSLAERDEVAIEYLEAQLSATVAWENARKFQSQLSEVRQKVEDRQRINVRSHEGARAWERKVKLVDRVKQLKLLQASSAEDIENITAAKIVTVELEVNPDAQIVLLPPLNLQRRMERVFGVSVDRSPDRNRQRTFILSGLEKDVNEAVLFVQQADFSGGFKVSVESRLMPQLIGRGGAGIRQLEETYKCFYQTRENNDLVIYGATSNAAKAAQHISQLKAERQAEQTVAVIPVDHAAICRSLTSVFLKKLREIESKNNVVIRASAGPPPGAGNSPRAAFGADVSKSSTSRPSSSQAAPERQQGASVLGGPTVTIRGPTKPAVDEARKEVTAFVSNLRTMEIPIGTPEALRRLFFRVSFNGEVDISRGQRSPTRSTQPGVGDKFCDLVGSNESVAFLRHGDGLALVGTPEDLEKVVEDVRNLTEVASYTSARVKVSPQQMPILSVARLAEISEATGAAVTTRRSRVGESDAVSYLDVLGSDAQKIEAEKMIGSILAREGVVKVLTLTHPETVNKLLRDRASMLRGLETNYGTRVSIDRTRLTCTIVGGPHGVEATEDALKAVEAKIALLVTKVVPIPSADLIGLIVGARGSNVTAIRGRSEVENLDIDDKELTVTLRGTEEQVAIAEEMLQNIFASNRRSAAPSRETPSTATSAPPASPQASRPGRTTPQFGVGWGESVVPEDEPATSAWDSSRPQGTWMSGPTKGTDGTAPAPNILGAAFPALDEVDQFDFQKPRRRRRGGRPAQTTTEAAGSADRAADVGAPAEHEEPETPAAPVAEGIVEATEA